MWPFQRSGIMTSGNVHRLVSALLAMIDDISIQVWIRSLTSLSRCTLSRWSIQKLKSSRFDFLKGLDGRKTFRKSSGSDSKRNLPDAPEVGQRSSYRFCHHHQGDGFRGLPVCESLFQRGRNAGRERELREGAGQRQGICSKRIGPADPIEIYS